MLPTITNLFRSPAPVQTGEQSFTLLQTATMRVEQIVSQGEASPPDFWYDQADPEWVALLRGHADLEFSTGTLKLEAGDTVLIPAGCRHRVAVCSHDAVWLALHFSGPEVG